jgi:hypothetical protein
LTRSPSAGYLIAERILNMDDMSTAPTPDETPRAASTTAHVKMPGPLLAEVDRLVGPRFLSRGEAFRNLIAAGLKAEASHA